MTEPPLEATEEPVRDAPPSIALAASIHPVNLWERIKEHKVLQWSLGYLGAALAVAHGTELLGTAYAWPHAVDRTVTTLLVLGFPLALILAWYHGHKGLRQVGPGEMMIIALLVVALGTAFVVLARAPEGHAAASGEELHEGATSSGPTAASGPAPAITADIPPASIAVMPFENLTGDPKREYFSDGMTEELIDALTRVPGLKVAARTSSFAYKGKNTDIRQIARELRVATLFEGSIRSAGERIRVTAQLISAESGYHFWSRSYDRQNTDVFKLQDDLAREIVAAFKNTMDAQLPAPLTRAPPTQDLEAYDLFLQASVPLATNRSDAMASAITLLDRAIARDPQFAEAYTAKSVALFILGSPLDEVEKAAKRAHEIDSTQGLLQLAQIDDSRRSWLEAEINFRASISVSAGQEWIHSFYGWHLMDLGLLRQALAEARVGFELVPVSGDTVSALALANSWLGLDADALRYARLGRTITGAAAAVPAEVFAARRAGRLRDAAELEVRSLPAYLLASDGERAVRLGYTAIGDPNQKAAALTALQTWVRGHPTLLTSEVEGGGTVLLLYTQLGALDQAYELAHRRLEELGRLKTGVVGAWTVLWLPEMRPFRQDLRFQELVTRLGMMDYWKQYGPPDDCDLRDGRLTCH